MYEEYEEYRAVNDHIYATMIETLIDRQPGESIRDPQSDISRAVQQEIRILRGGLGLDRQRISVISAIANIDLFKVRRSTPEDFGA